MDLNFFVSIKEYSKLSSKEMVNKSVQMERRYVGEIICFVVGSVLLYFGFFYNKEIVFNNIILSPIIFILSGIFFIITVFVGLFNKKERIENLLNHAETTKSKIKEYQKAGICGVITLSLADYLYKALELSINVGILLGVVAILVSLIYLFYLLKKPTNI